MRRAFVAAEKKTVMKDDCELDVVLSQVSELLDRGRENGLRKEDELAISAEVELLWARLSRATPKKHRKRVPA